MSNIHEDFWILDGREKTFMFKEEIKAQGGVFVPEFKCWKIPNISKDDIKLKVLKSCGLKVQVKISG